MAGEKTVSIEVVDHWVCPSSQGVRAALSLKGFRYEPVEENLVAGKCELFLRSNRVHKKIPVILHDGRPINESLVILQYLDEAFPSSRQLLPSDPYARAQARFWADYVDKNLPGCGSRLLNLEGDPLMRARAEMVEIFKTLEGELGEKEFFGGDHGFGLVDTAFAPFTSSFLSYQRYGKFKLEEVAPRIAAWAERVQKTQCVLQSFL